MPDGGWTASVLDDAGAAVRVTPADPGALVDAALVLAADRPAAERLARSGPAFAADHYGSGPALARYADVLRELLE